MPEQFKLVSDYKPAGDQPEAIAPPCLSFTQARIFIGDKVLVFFANAWFSIDVEAL